MSDLFEISVTELRQNIEDLVRGIQIDQNPLTHEDSKILHHALIQLMIRDFIVGREAALGICVTENALQTSQQKGLKDIACKAMLSVVEKSLHHQHPDEALETCLMAHKYSADKDLAPFKKFISARKESIRIMLEVLKAYPQKNDPWQALRQAEIVMILMGPRHKKYHKALAYLLTAMENIIIDKNDYRAREVKIHNILERELPNIKREELIERALGVLGDLDYDSFAKKPAKFIKGVHVAALLNAANNLEKAG